jgi:hypothetical protein
VRAPLKRKSSPGHVRLNQQSQAIGGTEVAPGRTNRKVANLQIGFRKFPGLGRGPDPVSDPAVLVADELDGAGGIPASDGIYDIHPCPAPRSSNPPPVLDASPERLTAIPIWTCVINRHSAASSG